MPGPDVGAETSLIYRRGGVGAGGGTSDGRERYAGGGGGGVRHWQRASRDAEARLHGERDAEANWRGVQAIYSSDLQQRRHDTAA